MKPQHYKILRQSLLPRHLVPLPTAFCNPLQRNPEQKHSKMLDEMLTV